MEASDKRGRANRDIQALGKKTVPWLMVFSCTEKHNLFKTLHKVLFQLKKKKKNAPPQPFSF